MTDDADRLQRKGRGYPPVEYRWAPGTSGNPKGRPRGAKNRKYRGITASEQIALDEAARPVTTSDGTLSTIQGVNRAHDIAALKGGVLAQRSYIERIARIEEKAEAKKMSMLATAEEYKRRYEEICNMAGDRDVRHHFDDLLPHPDDVEVDFDAGCVRILGPATTYERKVWREGLAALAAMRAMVVGLRREVRCDPRNVGRNVLLFDATDRFMRNNEQLPERYRLRPLPAWRTLPEMPDFSAG